MVYFSNKENVLPPTYQDLLNLLFLSHTYITAFSNDLWFCRRKLSESLAVNQGYLTPNIFIQKGSILKFEDKIIFILFFVLSEIIDLLSYLP